ncbi:hypothetical protein [Mangrovibacterium diazotrophicum]|uniref:Uncharacterized protein n=1 Tax=Mangrovibacterium diazotrophicum TaxID=1261403 RepID=A0A419W9V8_9BACT|nr:hypothetical protein [Mangrovibacterium diazotrophicum]RKD92247.1 hypothetical protein BC643_2618 [Mangrovibacterium diazotrophicum]
MKKILGFVFIFSVLLNSCSKESVENEPTSDLEKIVGSYSGQNNMIVSYGDDMYFDSESVLRVISESDVEGEIVIDGIKGAAIHGTISEDVISISEQAVVYNGLQYTISGHGDNSGKSLLLWLTVSWTAGDVDYIAACTEELQKN